MFYCILVLLLCGSPYTEGAIQVPQSPLTEMKQEVESYSEIAVMDSLIRATTRQLEAQKRLRQMMVDFHSQRDAFAAGNETKVHASLMVRTARQVYEGVSAYHLQHLFPQDYLDELLFFSSIAGKNTVKRP